MQRGQRDRSAKGPKAVERQGDRHQEGAEKRNKDNVNRSEELCISEMTWWKVLQKLTHNIILNILNVYIYVSLAQ